MTDLRETVATAVADTFDALGVRCTPARSIVVVPVADAAIAAIEPGIRTDERRKVFEELIAEAEQSDLFPFLSPTFYDLVDWLRDQQ